MTTVIENILKRLDELEDIVKVTVNEAVHVVFKAESAVVKGDVYILSTTTDVVAKTSSEGDTNPVVIIAESKEDLTGYGQVWPKCITSGLVWVNFEEGLSPTVRDYVITSAEEGKAKAVSDSQAGTFGRLIRWDDVSGNRGQVLMMGAGGSGVDNLKWWRQAGIAVGEPTPQEGVTNIWEDTDDGHLYKDIDGTWQSLTGYMG